MSMRQYGFLIGFLFVWMGWAVGFWQAVLALLVGLAVYFGVRMFQRDLDFNDVAERVSTIGRR